MQVVLDLVGVTQHWDPDTNAQTNTAQLVVGGAEIHIQLNEEQLKALIATGAQQAADPALAGFVEEPQHEQVMAEPDEELPTNAQGERVFGGDAGDQSHSLFQELNTDDIEVPAPAQRPAPERSSTQQRLDALQARSATTPGGQRKARKAELRARASRVPQARLSATEQGYPIVSKGRTVVAAPTVIEREIDTRLEDLDDAFDQG